MTIKLNNHVFIRHAKDESVVWCPRTGGCTVMRNAQVILNEVLSEGQSVDFIQLLIPAHVTGEDHLPFMEDRKYAIGGPHSLIDYSVGGADDLSKACVDRVRIGETFRRHYRPHVRIGAQWSYGFPYLDAPALSVLPGKFMRNRAQNTTQLIACGFGPIVGHDANPESISFSMESNSSSSEMNSPFSNSLREISIIRLKAARLRHDSISSHVLSKSATLIITLVLCPFCVMTMGRCVRAVRAKQSLRVRRYSVKGTTSSSRRGRSMVLAFVRMVFSPFENTDMVHYSVPSVNRAFSFHEYLEAA